MTREEMVAQYLALEPCEEYAAVVKATTYDPETGQFTKLPLPGKRLVGRRYKIGPVPKGFKGMTIDGRFYTMYMLAFIHMTRQMPPRKVMPINGDSTDLRWKNLTWPVGDTVDSRKCATGKALINGKIMSVDSSTPKQPRTPANQKRMAGECKDCKWYVDYCLEHNMERPCRGKEVLNKQRPAGGNVSGGVLHHRANVNYGSWQD